MLKIILIEKNAIAIKEKCCKQIFPENNDISKMSKKSIKVRFSPIFTDFHTFSNDFLPLFWFFYLKGTFNMLEEKELCKFINLKI